MRHIYGNRFTETDTEISLRRELDSAHKEIEQWQRIAQQTPVPIVADHGDHSEILGQANLILQTELSELHNAIRILTDVHTRDDNQIGFCIDTATGPSSFLHEHSQGDYIEAWKTLRQFIHKQTEPGR